MNCRHFQKMLHEFVDGTLPVREREAADKHLAICDACRLTLRKEQEISQHLSALLRENTESLVLPPQFQRRVAMAIGSRGALPSGRELFVALLTRLAWPLAIAASVCMAAFLTVVFLRGRNPSPETARSAIRDVASAISVRVTYRVPAYTFRREGNLVVDCLTFETNVVDTAFWAGRSRKPDDQERKLPL